MICLFESCCAVKTKDGEVERLSNLSRLSRNEGKSCCHSLEFGGEAVLNTITRRTEFKKILLVPT